MFDQGPDVQKMLLGQDFRRGHDGDLVSALDRHEGRRQGDNGFPAAHVALEEPVHRVGLAHVAFDFPDDAILGRGQGKGEEGAQFLGIAVRDREGDAFFQGGPAAAQGQADLHEKELLEDQPAMGRGFAFLEGLDVFLKIGEMGPPQGLGEGNEALSPADFRGKAAYRLGGELVHDPFLDAPDQPLPLIEALGFRVDRDDPLKMKGFLSGRRIRGRLLSLLSGVLKDFQSPGGGFPSEIETSGFPRKGLPAFLCGTCLS